MAGRPVFRNAGLPPAQSRQDGGVTGSIERGAEFDDALTRGFDGNREWKSGGLVEEQDDAVQFAIADAACER